MIDRRALGEQGNVVEDERDFAVLQKWAKSVTEQGSQLWHNSIIRGNNHKKG